MKRLASAAAVLASLCFTGWFGQNEMSADFVEQNSWRLIRAEAVPEGVEVETAGENLVLHAGVKVSADSEESRSFSAEKVRDGISDEESLRWSSANDWENNEHWLCIRFPQEVTAGLVRIYWERTNASAYALEYSDDGENWQTAAEFTEPPEEKKQDIYLDEPVTARYLRLHVTAVTKEETDLSLYYQNVSVLELEVYEGIKDSFLIRKPEIPAQSGRKLMSAKEAAEVEEKDCLSAVLYPEVPQGYELKFAGADYEMLVEADGRIADNIADVDVELGFALAKDGVEYELPGMTVSVPACRQGSVSGGDAPERSSVSKAQASDGENEQENLWQGAEEAGAKERQAALPDGIKVMEWSGGSGTFELEETVRVVIYKAQEETLLPTARLFAKELSGALGREAEVAVAEEDVQDPQYGHNEKQTDIFLYLKTDSDGEQGDPWISGLGDEGYEIRLGGQRDGFGDGIQIEGTTAQGVRWGCVSFLSLLEKSGGELPEGRMRDYPRYSVRGFGIDVGRRPISMELLYRIVEEMSKQKMNTLQIHLNDNQIIAQSDYDGTVEGARGLYAGFRLESELKNDVGVGITSTDLYYTKEEFAQFIADAAAYGVEIVPEIDTPAHSLSITKVFPQLGLSGNPESADQLDLSKTEAAELVKGLWSEYLTGGDRSAEAGQEGIEKMGGDDGQSGLQTAEEGAVFAGCSALHIGMDEYFGDEKEYISYLEEISDHIRTVAPDKTIRIWGSLSKIKADHSGVSKNLQMHIWDTDWADPQDMYDEGFSIINSLSSSLYIIPGGGYDWLDQEFLEEKWQPNIFETKERTWELPAYSSRMLGAVYMMWNDWSQLNGESITENDLFERFAAPLPVIAQKLWGSYEKQ